MILSLCGFMGCGKSTVGRNLAAFVYSDYIDLDEYIEKRVGMSVKEFFALNGEAAFREEEKRALEEILKIYSGCSVVSKCTVTECAEAVPEYADCHSEHSNLVLSLGGGAPTYAPTAKLIKEKTFCVYLTANKETLYRRLSKNNAKRPVLQGKQGDELMAFIEELIAKRENCYKEVSQMELCSSTLNIPQLTAKLAKLF